MPGSDGLNNLAINESLNGQSTRFLAKFDHEILCKLLIPSTFKSDFYAAVCGDVAHSRQTLIKCHFYMKHVSRRSKQIKMSRKLIKHQTCKVFTSVRKIKHVRNRFIEIGIPLIYDI